MHHFPALVIISTISIFCSVISVFFSMILASLLISVVLKQTVLDIIMSLSALSHIGFILIPKNVFMQGPQVLFEVEGKSFIYN